MTDINVEIKKSVSNIDVSVEKKGGTSNYNELENKPFINGVELTGNKTTADIGIEVDTSNLATKEELEEKANKTEIPTAVSQLENDIGYLNEHQDISGLATKEEIQTVKAVIPSTANTQNKLADKGFVNSSIQTSTAHFRGSWGTWEDVPSDSSLYPVDAFNNHEPTSNDYLVIVADEQQDGGTWRYKYTGLWSEQGKDGWKVEYQINETPLTAEQVAALNSGITAEAVAGLSDYVKNTDYANSSRAGVIKGSTIYGANTNSSGILTCRSIALSSYKGYNDSGFISKKTLETVKTTYVKEGITNNNIDLTEDEKVSACNWLGTSRILPITQADYDLLETKDSNTLYLIEEE